MSSEFGTPGAGKLTEPFFRESAWKNGRRIGYQELEQTRPPSPGEQEPRPKRNVALTVDRTRDL